MNDLVLTAAPENFLVPDRQTIQSDFDKAANQIAVSKGALEEKRAEERTEAVMATFDLMPEIDMPTALYGHQGNVPRAVSQRRAALQWDAALGILLIVAGVFCFGVVSGVLGSDFAILYQLFKSNFTNAYDELSAEGAFLAILAALQALLVVLIYKAALNSPKRVELAIWAGLVMVAVYGLALLLDSGFKKTAEIANTAATGIGWRLPMDTAPDGPSELQILALFALGLPYILLPLAGGIFGAIGLAGFLKGVKAQIAWRQFRERHAKLKGHVHAASAAEAQINTLQDGWANQTRHLAQERVDALLSQAREMIEIISRARIGGEKRIVVPGPGGMTISDMDYAMKLAVEARTILGSGFVEREFQIWIAARGYSNDGRSVSL